MKKQLVAVVLMATGTCAFGAQFKPFEVTTSEAELSSKLTEFVRYLGDNQNKCDSTHIKDLASVAQIALNTLKSIQARQKQKVEAEESRLSDVNHLIRQVEADMRLPSDDKKSNKANGQE